MATAFSVGLTGGVGSGKSTIATMLSRLGAAMVDADAVAHQLTAADGTAMPALRETFGAEVIAADGSLDRARMRTLAFSDAAVRRQLESLLHPMIRVAMRDGAAELIAGGSPYVVFVIPLLVEAASGRSDFDRILLIDCSETIQIARVRSRPGIDEALARKMIAVQATRQQRLAMAHDVLVNEAPLELMEGRVELLHRSYLQYAELKQPRATL